LWVHEEGSELGGGDLKADFRQLLGVVFAEVIGEMILEVREAELVFLLGTPFLVTAASAPIGDIAFSDGDVALGKSPDDFGIGNVVVEEFVDHIAFEFGQAGDFAVAHALTEGAGGGGRSRDDAGDWSVRGLMSSRLDGSALDESAFLFDTVRAVVEKIFQSGGGDSALRESFGVDNGGELIFVTGIGDGLRHNFDWLSRFALSELGVVHGTTGGRKANSPPKGS